MNSNTNVRLFTLRLQRRQLGGAAEVQLQQGRKQMARIVAEDSKKHSLKQRGESPPGTTGRMYAPPPPPVSRPSIVCIHGPSRGVKGGVHISSASHIHFLPLLASHIHSLFLRHNIPDVCQLQGRCSIRGTTSKL
jgi:hypothetical protein